jgi:hypothetical protein
LFRRAFDRATAAQLVGARTQQILVSVLRTCWQQGKDAFTRMVSLLRAPQDVTLDIVTGAD